jgi:hypothetical protein
MPGPADQRAKANRGRHAAVVDHALKVAGRTVRYDADLSSIEQLLRMLRRFGLDQVHGLTPCWRPTAAKREMRCASGGVWTWRDRESVTNS